MRRKTDLVPTLQGRFKASARKLTPVILPLRRWGLGRLQFEAIPGNKLIKTPSQSLSLAQWHACDPSYGEGVGKKTMVRLIQAKPRPQLKNN
jgi:hypothetical protein